MGFLPRREPAQGAGLAKTSDDARPGEPDQLQEALLGAARSARRESNSSVVGGAEANPQEGEVSGKAVKAPNGDAPEATEHERRRRLWVNRKRREVSAAEASLAEERDQFEAA